MKKILMKRFTTEIKKKLVVVVAQSSHYIQSPRTIANIIVLLLGNLSGGHGKKLQNL